MVIEVRIVWVAARPRACDGACCHATHVPRLQRFFSASVRDRTHWSMRCAARRDDRT